MNFESRSQAGQDAFINAILGGKRDGTFVDIGCSHPVNWSNTYALEQLGWKGVMIDSDQNAVDLCRQQRIATVHQADARTVHWGSLIIGFPEVIDYASVDVDEHTHDALKRLLGTANRQFRVLTVEHDRYQRDDRLRIPNRELLKALGYELLAADVCSNGCCFEDWHLDPKLVDMEVAERFRSEGLDWQEVLKQGGAL